MKNYAEVTQSRQKGRKGRGGGRSQEQNLAINLSKWVGRGRSIESIGVTDGLGKDVKRTMILIASAGLNSEGSGREGG